jgi:hypothetical protein
MTTFHPESHARAPSSDSATSVPCQNPGFADERSDQSWTDAGWPAYQACPVSVTNFTVGIYPSLFGHNPYTPAKVKNKFINHMLVIII